MKLLLRCRSLTTFFSAFCLIGFSALVSACEYHDTMGFGAFNHGMGFRSSHPLAQNNLPARKTPQVTIEYDKPVRGRAGQDQSIIINYHLPPEFEDAYLRFTAGEGIEVNAQESISIDSLTGEYALEYLAKEEGKRHVLVLIDAMKDKLPYSRVYRIDLAIEN
uniref:hypothetical protein n=1 Tax=Ningiella ruwaisensis TaxID=2364274 RepID=UPI0010A047E3|nr:hypothetical protein [Ningiella ruwaisensis]